MKITKLEKIIFTRKYIFKLFLIKWNNSHKIKKKALKSNLNK